MVIQIPTFFAYYKYKISAQKSKDNLLWELCKTTSILMVSDVFQKNSVMKCRGEWLVLIMLENLSEELTLHYIHGVKLPLTKISQFNM